MPGWAGGMLEVCFLHIAWLEDHIIITDLNSPTHGPHKESQLNIHPNEMVTISYCRVVNIDQ